jgi:GT2 family glycosyltransferase
MPPSQATRDVRRSPGTVDLTVIIVSFNDAHWLDPCLRSLRENAGDISIETVVVDNGTDGAARRVQSTFPWARTMTTENWGFAHANNRGALTAGGRYLLFLNPDTELIGGTLAELIAVLDAHPEVGLAGARQVTADGTVWPTIRYFPSIGRALGDGLGLERWRRRPRWAGERELDMARYDRETECDWTSGSFMCVRREAVLSAGLMDERFFVYSEEPDLCLRIKQAGWAIRHVPCVTILHHAGKAGRPAKIVAQEAFTRRQYARKHFGPAYRFGFLAAVASSHLIRAVSAPPPDAPDRRGAARLALRTLLGLTAPPFALPPRTALPVGLGEDRL